MVSLQTSNTGRPPRPAPAVGRAETIIDRAGLARVAPEISALLDEAGAPASARWAALTARLQLLPHLVPWVTTIRRDGRLVAAALLTRRDIGTGHLIASMNESHLPGSLPALDAVAAADLAVATAQQLGTLRRPWRLDINTLATAGAANAALAPLAARLDHCVVEVVARSPRLVFEPGSTLNTYLSRNTRSARAKARNRIAKAGLDMQLQWHRRPADVETQLADVLAVSRARDRHSGQQRVLDKAHHRAMYLGQARAYARDGRLRLLTLRISGDLAAFAMVLESNGMLYVHSNRAAPDWLHYSPGLIVNAEVVEHAHADAEICGVDWGGSAQRFKMSGGAELQDYVSLHAWSGPAARGLDGAVHRARITAGALVHAAQSTVGTLRSSRTASHPA